MRKFIFDLIYIFIPELLIIITKKKIPHAQNTNFTIKGHYQTMHPLNICYFLIKYHVYVIYAIVYKINTIIKFVQLSQLGDLHLQN